MCSPELGRGGASVVSQKSFDVRHPGESRGPGPATLLVPAFAGMTGVRRNDDAE